MPQESSGYAVGIMSQEPSDYAGTHEIGDFLANGQAELPDKEIKRIERVKRRIKELSNTELFSMAKQYDHALHSKRMSVIRSIGYARCLWEILNEAVQRKILFEMSDGSYYMARDDAEAKAIRKVIERSKNGNEQS